MFSQEERMKIFWASSPQNVRPIPTIEISHSHLPSTYRYWTEPYIGTVKNESVSDITMNPANMTVSLANSQDNLDQNYNIAIDLTDAQDILREALDIIPVNTKEQIVLTYREYLSDTLAVIQSSVSLIVQNISYSQEGAKFKCVTPRMNLTSSGESYNPFDIPMLRGFL